jgi:hypothetical protein
MMCRPAFHRLEEAGSSAVTRPTSCGQAGGPAHRPRAHRRRLRGETSVAWRRASRSRPGHQLSNIEARIIDGTAAEPR